jgi:hypothetical protein
LCLDHRRLDAGGVRRDAKRGGSGDQRELQAYER